MVRAPVVELLKYVELAKEEEEAKAKKEEMDRWLSYLALIHSSPFGDTETRQKFIDLIKPKEIQTSDVPKYETDVSLLERLKASQEGGKASGND